MPLQGIKVFCPFALKQKMKNRNKYGDNDEGDREEDEEEGYTKKENL